MGYQQDVQAVWEKEPDAGAIEFEGKWFPWRQVANSARQLTKIFSDNGVPQNALIGIIARNRPGPASALSCLLGLDRCFTMIYSAQTPAGIAADLDDMKLAAVIGDPKDWTEETIAAAKRCGTLAIVADLEQESEMSLIPGADKLGAGPFETVQSGIAMELLSSGTTGKPKRLPLTVQAFQDSVTDAVANYGAAPKDGKQPGIVVFHPISNMAAVTFMVPWLALGQPVCLMERFSLPVWLDAIERHRPTRTSLPPAVLRSILDQKIPRESLRNVASIGVGAAMLDPDLQKEFEDTYGIPLLISYGATEFCGVIANWTPELHKRERDRKRGSVGIPRPGVEMRVVDADSGKILGPKQIGILEAIVPRMGADWIRTTDLASIDEDGFLFLHGRSDHAINRGGFKVLPDTVAAAIRQHPDVLDATVVGMPDSRLGEVPMAGVELREGSTENEESIKTFIRDRLLAYEVPTVIRIYDSMPRNASLKVDLVALKKSLAEVAA